MTSHKDLGASARRIGLIGLLTLLGALGAVLLHGAAFPQSVAAEKCETCEEEEPPIEEEVFETLTVKVEGAGSVSDGTETVCSSGGSTNTCEVEYALGEKVTLSAAPMPGMTFLGWEGSSCSGTGTCSVTMTSAKSVTARFADKTPPPSPNISSPTSEQLFEWESGTVEVKFTGFEAAAFYCGLDSNSFAAAVGCGSPWSIKDPTEGTHTVYVWAKDAAGNISTPASSSFKVVITPPAEEGGGGEEPPKEEGGGGSGDGGGTPSGGSTSPIPTIAPPPAQINAQAVVKARASGKWTIFRKLVLKGLPSGAAVAATCKGKGCPFKRKKITVRNGVADLTALFAKRQLGAGALIELKVTAPGMTGQTIDVKTRAGKAPKAGEYEAAVPVLEEAVRSFPEGSEDLNYAYALFNLGDALRLSGRPEDATPVLEQRLQIPNQTSTVQKELEAARAEAGTR